MVANQSREMFDFEHVQYFDFVREIIEEYNLLFTKWLFSLIDVPANVIFVLFPEFHFQTGMPKSYTGRWTISLYLYANEHLAIGF